MSNFLKKLEEAIKNNKDSEESSEFIKKINAVHEEAEKKSKKLSNLSDGDKENKLEELSGNIKDIEVDVNTMLTEKEYIDSIKTQEEKLMLIAEIENKRNEVKLYKKEVEHYLSIIEKSEDYIDEQIKLYEEKYEEEYKGIDGAK